MSTETRGRQSKYKSLDTFEEKGLISASRLTKRLSLSHAQLTYWTEEGYIKEAPDSLERRRKIKGAIRYFEPEQAVKVAYMAYLINDIGLRPKMASKFSELLKDKIEPIGENNLHWIKIKQVTIGIPHLGGLNEIRIRPSRRIGQAVAG